MERLFGIDAQLLFDAAILAVNIFVLFIGLSYFLFNPVKKLLKDRQDRITAEREQTEADKNDAETLKKQYEETNPSSGGTKNNCNKNTGDKKRSVILFQYLQQEYGLKKYLSLGKSVVLDADTLEKIIKARNDLTHRGDQSKVTLLMYHHLIPILQEILRKL